VCHHTWWKNWVNCTVLTGNSTGLRIVLSSCLSHTELHSSLRESHSFLSLPANTRFPAIHSTVEHHIPFKYHLLLDILRFLLFFSDNIMVYVASKQQTTALFLSTVVTHTRRHTELTQKNWQTWWGNLCCAREHSVQFFMQFFFNTFKLHSLT
jgi:hypothetical protein